MTALDLFRSCLDYQSIADILGTTEEEIERIIHRLRQVERIIARWKAMRKAEDTKAKWQRTKAHNAEIRRRYA